MKLLKISLLIVFLILPLTVFSQSQKVSITFQRASLDYNNSVGNEWSTRARVNGRYLFRGDSIHVNLSSDTQIRIQATAVESEKYPDRGTGSKNIILRDIKGGESTIITIPVTVREDRGRYAGNTAKWSFQFEIKQI